MGDICTSEIKSIVTDSSSNTESPPTGAVEGTNRGGEGQASDASEAQEIKPPFHAPCVRPDLQTLAGKRALIAHVRIGNRVVRGCGGTSSRIKIQ